jgi:hypothetical protein
MKNLFSSLAFVLVFIVLGAMALAAAPRSAKSVDPVIAASQPTKQEHATEATYSWYAVALPLDIGVTVASELANYIDSDGSVMRAAKWNADPPSWVIWNPGNPRTSVDFPVTVGTSVMLAIDSAATFSAATLVGDVPPMGTIGHSLTANAWHFIMVPLDQSGAFSNAEGLANDIGAVDKVAYWNQQGSWVIWERNNPRTSVNFAVSPGYPYMIKVGATTPTTWP